MRRILALFLIIATLAASLSLFSCDGGERDRDYNEEELLKEAEKLIKQADLLNEIFYGKGISYDELSASSYGNYKQALIFDLEKYGFFSISELKEKAEAVFTKGYSENIFSTILDSIKDDDDNVRYFARYIEVREEEEADGVIFVSTTYTPLYDGEIEYDYSTLSVYEVKGERITVSVKATITTSDNKVQSTNKRITLIEEDLGWRIDSPSYIVYNEYKDRYEELDKELD